MIDASDKEKAIYDQNCQWFRYQDTLRWGRFQTMAAIEGGMLYGLYQTTVLCFEKRALVIFGSLLIMIISRIAMIDGHYATEHLRKIKEFEGYVLKRPKGPRGGTLMLSAMILLTVVNLALIVRTFISTQ
jgi:hypothetical protein